MDNIKTEYGSDSKGVTPKAAVLLLVIGEPFSEEHKKLILGEISKGFRCWDNEATGIDINDELAQIANRADLGEEGPNGERVIRHSSENLEAEIQVNPLTQTVNNGVKNFLSSPSKHKHLIYAGHAFKGSGAWILQDDTYTFSNFAHAFKDQDVGNAVRQQQGSSLYIYTESEGDWISGHIAKNDFSKFLAVQLNPAEKLETMHGVLQFTAYLSNFVRVRQLNELLQSSDVVGNIRFSRPTLYIFPGCQGDSALFGISGFNLLINGGYSRKACFWDFTRHLDRIDAALMTHLGTDNLFGFGSVLQRKSIENVHPEIGFMYVNASDKIKALQQAECTSLKEDNLLVNLAEEGNKLIQYAKQIGPIPQSCSRTQKGQTIEPINLYHKVGIGSLDMYILNPITDSKEMKEFYQQWNQNVAQFGTSQHMPLPNTLSVCALLVWQPSDPSDNITRIFFPGNAPQHKVLEGLEKLKTLDILKNPKCTKASLLNKPVAKKASGLASKQPARSKISPVTTPRNEVQKKEMKEQPVAKSSALKNKAPQPPLQKKKEKEDVNKKTMKAPEKMKLPEKVNKGEKISKVEKSEKTDNVGKNDKKTEKGDKSSKADKVDKSQKLEKTDKSKKTSSPEKSAKSSASSTPKKAESPVKSASDVVKIEAEIGTAPTSNVPDIIDTAPVAEIDKEPYVNGSQESSVDPPAFSSELLQPEQVSAKEQPQSLIDITPESVPEPAQPSGALDKEKMLELGIYDEDHDIEQELNAQRPEDNSDKRLPQMFGGMADSMHEDLTDESSSQNVMQGSFHGDLMTGSFHEAMYDNKKPFDGPFIQNGSVIDEVTTPEDDTSEEIQPQALPEPVAYAPKSYGKEPDIIPTVIGKDEPEAVPQVETSSTSQDPDLLPVKQEADESHGHDEESTLPVEEKCGYPAMIETPDEVASSFPEDIQEKDLNEKTEKEAVSDELDIEKKDAAGEYDFENGELEEPCEEIPSADVIKDVSSTEMVGKRTLGESENVHDQESNESAIESRTELMSESSQQVQIQAASYECTDDRDIQGYSPEPELLPQENEPELETVDRDSPDIPDVIERPESPEPDQLEQDKVISKSIEELGFVPQPLLPEKVDDSQVDRIDESEKRDELNGETPESEEERAESPDSQLGAQEVSRDSLEREIVKEGSPISSDDQSDSIERDTEKVPGGVELVGNEEEQRDSTDRSLSPDLEQEKITGITFSQIAVTEQRNVEEPNFGTCDERTAMPSFEPEQRDSTERSFEDESDESEEDEDDEESSSFEQEEATDEKCLIQDSASEDHRVIGSGEKLETDILVAPTDSLASDNLLTPESEYTDASHGGQVGYHDIDEQDVDSVEGIEEKDASAPVPLANDGLDQLDGQNVGTGAVRSNPFEISEQSETNPFIGYEQTEPEVSSSPDDDIGTSGGLAKFNPLAEWGEPMGLPSPAPPEEKNETASAKKGTPKDEAKKSQNDTKKTDAKRPASATKKPAPKPMASNGIPDKAKNRLSLGGPSASGANLNSSRLSTGGKLASKSRPATAPTNADTKSKVNGTKRPASSTGSRASPAAVKMPALPPFHPFYVDLTYIPNHGNPGYSDVEYFKRVRARYYVLSALSPNTHILDALLEGKKTWEDKSLQVTVIPTYDNETLRLWMSLHKEKLADEKVEIAPSASRCTIQLQDHETSSSAYRLEF